MEIIEVIRRWQAGESARSVARATGVAHNSVDKYLRLATAAGLVATFSATMVVCFGYGIRSLTQSLGGPNPSGAAR